MGSGKHRWKISFLRPKQPTVPQEFLCPISGSLMADPVIAASGHIFERRCVDACKSLSFLPTLPDGSKPDFSAVIPNLALKSAILNWCRSSLLPPPQPLDFLSAQTLLRSFVSVQTHVDSRVPSHFSVSSVESVTTEMDSTPASPLPISLTTRPSCYSSSSSSEMEILNPGLLEEEEILGRLKSSRVFEQEEAVANLRKLTRTREETRLQLCTPRILAALRLLITSRYSSVQVNSVAALVNLSLENQNRVKIVRSGIVPPLIDALRGGFPEAQEHAAGALFSLALDDQNKTAIGVLGALPPLLHALRSESERTRHDSALALYHLSLVQSNRAKMVKLGAMPCLLGMVRSGHMTVRVLLVLCNLAASVEGRGAMLDGGAVECFMGMLNQGDFDSESTRECCLVALYGLSHGGLRFKGLAKEAGAEEILMRAEQMGSQRAREKAKKVLQVLREKDDEEEEVDWEELLNSDDETGGTQLHLI